MSYQHDVKPDIKPKLEHSSSNGFRSTTGTAFGPGGQAQAQASGSGSGSSTAPRPKPMEKPIDEELSIQLPSTGGLAWAVKIPTFLYERWAMVRREGVHLGTLMVDSSTTPPIVRLKIPKDELATAASMSSSSNTTANGTSTSTGTGNGAGADTGTGTAKPEDKKAVKAEDLAAWTGYDTTYLPGMFELTIPVERSKNTYVFKESKRDSVAVRDGALGKRKREKANPVITNAVAHECHLHPVYDEAYERILRARRAENEVSRRPVQHLEDYASQGRINQLSSGHAAIRSSFGSGMASMSRETPKSKDKLPRQDRPILRDRLFALFREKPYWNISVLKQELSQPDVWLREVLRDVAVQVKEGPYRDMWELKEALRMLGPGGKAGDVKSVKGEGEEQGEGDGDVERDSDGEEYGVGDLEDEDEDEDFEEVME